MDIQNVQDAAVIMESKAIDAMKEQGEAVVKLVETAPPPVSDPALGNNVDLLD